MYDIEIIKVEETHGLLGLTKLWFTNGDVRHEAYIMLHDDSSIFYSEGSLVEYPVAQVLRALLRAKEAPSGRAN